MGTIKVVQDIKTISHLPVVHWALYPEGNGEKEYCDNNKLMNQQLEQFIPTTYHTSFQMKVCIVLLLATVALTAIVSATNAHTSHEIEGVQNAQGLVEGQLGWITDPDNQLSGIR